MPSLSTSTRISTSQTQMVPSQHHSAAKRKLPDDSNPLLNAAKKAKKEKGGASNKRKLLNAEEQPGGLLIVRAPISRPPSAQDAPSLSLPPPIVAGPSKPVSKKFKASSQPTPASRPSSRAKSDPRDRDVVSSNRGDPEIENDIRAMEDEADYIRRHSRAHTTIDPTISTNLEFQFPARPDPNTTSKKSKAKITDTSLRIPANETPQIERNKLMREGAMNAIGNGRASGSDKNGRDPAPSGHRRKSSVSRGKRISSSFEATGVITQPHNSVSDTSFYKHIDCDLLPVERIRQLLIWCSSRAASTYTSPLPSQSDSSAQLPPALPPLTTVAASLLKSVQEDVVKMLAEKKIDLSSHPSEVNGGGTSVPEEKQKENEQNVTNRGWEVTYSDHIQRAQDEDENWKKVSYVYDAYTKKAKAGVEKRRAELQEEIARLEKVKGKQRDPGGGNVDAEADMGWIPREHELSEEFQRGVSLARRVLGMRPKGEERVLGSAKHGGVGSGKEVEEELKRRLDEVEFKLDQIHTFANAARATTNIAERALDQRFAVLSINLAARSNTAPPPLFDPQTGSGSHLLTTYVKRDIGEVPDPQDLMRALARVDRARPPAMIGDAARRAAREVQRVGESGVAAVGERRLTGVPLGTGSQTPRKTPGTPRRGSTPGRDRDRDR